MTEPSRSTREECLARLRRERQPIEHGQAIEIDSFRPEDAEGVARLYYEIYGETFPIDYVYDPERIRQVNSSGEVHQFVARTPRGEIVGLSALFNNPPNPRIMESGSLMLLPQYRGSTIAQHLLQRSIKEGNECHGLQAVFGQSVCDHLLTQRLVSKLGMLAWALELEAMPARPQHASYSAPGARISLLNEMTINQDTPHAVHLPRRNREFLRGMYESAGLKREFLPPSPLTGASEWASRRIAEAGLSRISFTRFGADLESCLMTALAEAGAGQEDHCQQLIFPLNDPGLSEAVDLAARNGFFLGGILPLWTGSDVLLLQRLKTRPRFEDVKLLSQRAQELLHAIRTDWQALS